MLKRGIAAFCAVLILVGLAVGVTSAQSNGGTSGNGFRISPVRSEISVEKGKSTTISITIENPTDFETVAKPLINDFVASDKENGEPRLILDAKAPRPKNDFQSLVQPISDINLAPKEKKDITVRIAIPANANAGGYYGAIRFVPSSSNNAGNVSLTASVGTIVLVTVPGNLSEKMDLEQLGASQNLGAGQAGKFKSFFTSGNVNSSVRLKNTGDIHLQPFGKVQIKNMFGKVVKEYELNAAKANVLPDSIRRYDEAVAKPKSGWFGRYTISANLGYSQGSGQLITSKAVFWYIPTWAIFVLIALILLIVGGIYMLVRKHTGAGHRKR